MINKLHGTYKIQTPWLEVEDDVTTTWEGTLPQVLLYRV